MPRIPPAIAQRAARTAATLLLATCAAALAAADPIVLADDQRRLLNVTTATARAASTVAVDGLLGEVTLPVASSSALTAPFAGLVTQVLADEGDRVARGDVLAWIDSREIADARARRRMAEVARELARARAVRDRRLLDEGIIPAARQEASAAELAARETELKAAAAALFGHDADAGAGARYALRAPLDGVVVERHVTAGAPLDTLEVAFMLLADDGLRLELQVPATIAARVAPGTRVMVDGVGATVSGRAAAIDPHTQTVEIRAQLPAGGPFMPGQRVSASIELPAPAGAVEVPRSALVRSGSGNLVYRADGDSLEALDVELHGESANSAVISAPQLSAGDGVVATGTSALRAMAR